MVTEAAPRGVCHVGVKRAHCNDINVEVDDPNYVFNERFRVSAKPREAWDNNDVRFKSDKHNFVHSSGYSKEYRTVYGPSFKSNTIMPHCNNEGMRGAVRRITSVREPLLQGVHEELIENQRNLQRTLGVGYSRWVQWFRGEFQEILTTKGSAVSERNRWCDAPHPKRELRQKVRKQIYFLGRDHGMRMKRVRYKCKINELLKKGKNPRGIGDLSCPGSSVAGYAFEWVKEAFSHEYTDNNFTLQFVKTPEKQLLSRVFDKLLHPTGTHMFYFSDDACLSSVCIDGVFTANLDISQCDGSHYFTFDVLKELIMGDARYDEDFHMVFEQCSSDFVVYSTDWKERIRFKPDGKILYSGSVLTTSLNNVANSLIGLNINRLLGGRRVLKAELRRIIVRAAYEMGFLLKIDECQNHGDIQFLKHSPAIVGDLIVPYKNIGAQLRGFGTCVGDLPGKAKLGIGQRAANSNNQTVRSWVHDGNTSVFRSFWQRWVGEGRPDDLTELDTVRIPDSELALRYKLTTSQVEELCELISGAGIGDCVNTEIVDRVFAKDYGY